MLAPMAIGLICLALLSSRQIALSELKMLSHLPHQRVSTICSRGTFGHCLESQRHIRMLPVHEVKRREFGARVFVFVFAVVVSEFDRRQMLVPVVLVRADECPQHLLKCPVGPFSLPIRLGISSCGFVKASAS
jgi:hypothetical protein